MRPNSEEITVVINPDGTVTTEVHGVKGKSCTDITKQLNAALGTARETTLTKEYNDRPTEVSNARRVNARS